MMVELACRIGQAGWGWLVVLVLVVSVVSTAPPLGRLPDLVFILLTLNFGKGKRLHQLTSTSSVSLDKDLSSLPVLCLRCQGL